MEFSPEVESMYCIKKGPQNGPAPIPQEGKWVQAKEVKDIFGLTHGVGWCAPHQGACKLTLNIKAGIIEEALIETIGCTGMTHSAAMASEILPGKTILEALNTDLVCDAINVAMRELFLQIVYGRSQTAFSEGGLPVGAGLEDLGKGLRSVSGTMYGTSNKGARYMEMAEGYVSEIGLDEDDEMDIEFTIALDDNIEDLEDGGYTFVISATGEIQDDNDTDTCTSEIENIDVVIFGQILFLYNLVHQIYGRTNLSTARDLSVVISIKILHLFQYVREFPARILLMSA